MLVICIDCKIYDIIILYFFLHACGNIFYVNASGILARTVCLLISFILDKWLVYEQPSETRYWSLL